MIKRIFWKFFGAFWLANIAITLATSYVLLHHSESERIKEAHKQGITLLVDRLLDDENFPHLQHRNPKRYLRRLFKNPHDREQVIHIYEGGKLLYKIESGENPPTPTFSFELTTEDGRLLQIHTLGPRHPKALIEALERIHKLHLFFMLLAATLVSLLLSWHVTRPLKRLGYVSRQFATGNHTSGVDKKLLQRGDEIGQLARDLDYMLVTIQNTLTAQKRLLHDVSHELRAPLARLQVAAELIQQKDSHNSAHVQRIHQECERIDQLIQRILNYSRLEQSAEPKLFDLKTVVHEQVENARYENPQRKFNLVECQAPLTVFARSELLHQAMENIIRNACKYTPAHTDINIQLEHHQNRAILKFRDFGQGVPNAELQKLSEPFFRGGEKMHGSGYGLGLSIAHRAIEAHNGTLEFSNHPNGGLVVTVTLPLAQTETT